MGLPLQLEAPWHHLLPFATPVSIREETKSTVGQITTPSSIHLLLALRESRQRTNWHGIPVTLHFLLIDTASLPRNPEVAIVASHALMHANFNT